MRLVISPFILRVLPAIVALTFSSACGEDIIPPIFDPDRWWWTGDARPMHVLSISAPDAVQKETSAVIKFVTWEFGRVKTVKDQLIIDEASRVISKLIEVRPYDSYLGHHANIPPPQENEIAVKFPTMGEWTIRVNDKSKRVIVYGDWAGEERVAQISNFILPAYVYTNVRNTLKVALSHENGEWFYSAAVFSEDSEKRILNVRIYEKKAESVFVSEGWEEEVEIPIFIGSAETWRIILTDNLFADRFIWQRTETDLIHYSGLHLGENGVLGIPESVSFEEPVREGIPTKLILTHTEQSPHTVIWGIDYAVNSENLKLNCKLWVSRRRILYPELPSEKKDFYFDLTFPEAGNWEVVFLTDEPMEGKERLEPLVTSVEVIPQEET